MFASDALVMLLVVLPLFWILLAVTVWAGVIIWKKEHPGKAFGDGFGFETGALVFRSIFHNKYHDTTLMILLWIMRIGYPVLIISLFYLK